MCTSIKYVYILFKWAAPSDEKTAQIDFSSMILHLLYVLYVCV